MKTITLFSLASLLVMMSPTFSQTQNPNSGTYIDWAGAWQYGTSGAIAVDTVRNYAFLASGGAVLTLDVSNPSDPQLINKDIRTNGQVLDIQVDYNNMNLLFACDEAGLQIWDIHDVENPSQTGSLEIMYGGVETPVRHVEQYGDFAITENEWGYVHTINISDPANPFQVDLNGDMGNPAHDISVSSNGYIHASGQQYFVLLKINPDGSLNLLSNYYSTAGSVFGTNEASFISLNGNLYIIDYLNGGSSSTPVSFNDIIIRDNMAYLIDNTSFKIYDVSDLHSPTFVGQVETSGGLNQIDIMGHYAFISSGYNGMNIIDFSNPSAPEVIATYEGTGVTWKSKLLGNYSFIANSLSGISIIDISNPYGNGPVKVAGIESNGETRDLDIENNTLFFADWTGGLRIYDVSNPESPTLLGSIDNIQAWRVEAEGNYLYLDNANANNPDTLQVYDISDLNSPVLVADMLLPDLIWKIMYYQGFLYVASNNDGLQVIDVTDPINPIQVNTLDLPSVSDFDIENNVAYIASTDWNGGLVTVDVTHPYNPEIINIYNPSGWFQPFHVSVTGDYAYTGENFGDIKLFDVTDPASPVELDGYVTSGDIVSLESVENYLYVSDGSDGLQIIYNSLTTDVQENNKAANIFGNAYPNPFHNLTTISLFLNESSDVQVGIYDLSGRSLSTLFKGQMSKGKHTLHWNGTSSDGGNLPSNIYFYKVSGKGFVKTGKLILQR
jgi:hypothetical protein